MADLCRNPLLLLALGLIGIPTALMLLGQELTDETQSIISNMRAFTENRRERRETTSHQRLPACLSVIGKPKTLSNEALAMGRRRIKTDLSVLAEAAGR